MQKKNNQDKKYIFNPGYGLRPDKKRILIYQKNIDPVQDKELTDILSFIHPVIAVILSFFNGQDTLAQVVDKLSAFLRLGENDVLNIISPLLENPTEFHFDYDGGHFHIPARVIIENRQNKTSEYIDIKKFFIPKKELDFKSWRLYEPLDILFIVNFNCITDCIYCYADRRNASYGTLELQRLKEIIREAAALGIRSFDISGGEFFLHPQWEELLKELIDNGYPPNLSTKIPIDENTVVKLKNFGVKNLQISIDSIIDDELIKILNVTSDYPAKLKETLRLLDKYGIDIYTNSHLNSINQNNMEKLIDFLLTLKNIRRLNVGAAGFSLYSKVEYDEFQADLHAVRRIEEYINHLKNIHKNRNINLNFSSYLTKDSYYKPREEKEKLFRERARCSGNFYALILLPDGKVTICEELYYNSHFIIGDLKTQSIMEVWNSERAHQLFRMSKDFIRQESVCKDCDERAECRHHRGVCWKEVLYAYGDNNWDYPDPRCHHAPPPHRKFFIDNIE